MDLTKRSFEWWQGYNYQGPRHLNPYHMDSEKFENWREGWQCRYYGEEP